MSFAIYVDADACPVKEEVYRVASRHQLKVFVVANKAMRVPEDGNVELVVVPGDFDAADNWIVEHIVANDIVISADILLAARCVEKKSAVLGPTGREFTEEAIGDAVASREISAHLREWGAPTKGPAPFDKRDRSRFLQSLDTIVQRAKRA